MDIFALLDDLNTMVVVQPRFFFNKIAYGMDPDQASQLIAKIRSSLPNELKQANARQKESERLVYMAQTDASAVLENAHAESEKIIADARNQAAQIIDDAKLEQERLVQASEILKLSKAQSDEIRGSADRDARQTRRGAEEYALAVLNQLEGVVQKVNSNIESGKRELSKSDSALVQTRERTRI